MAKSTGQATGLMADFARRTGLTSEAPPRRYLWTDAFAVQNYLDLLLQTGGARYCNLATGLIDAVHHVLGRHRPDDPRTGWLSGLSEAEGAQHPTQGGLRIGKPLPERGPDEPVNERLEWDRDGQYFHYLTKWMDALTRASTVLDEPSYRRYAVELGRAVFLPFLRRGHSGKPAGLAWKMSVDLSRPLVSGMNPHDALDGYVTLRQMSHAGECETEINILRKLVAGERWATSDPLGLGGLLSDAYRLVMLPERVPAEERMIQEVLAGADVGLEQFLRQGSFAAPAARRLAFRELGLAIGLATLPSIATRADTSPSLRQITPHLDSLLSHRAVGTEIAAFWSDPRHHEALTWQDHRDINEVMLATTLIRADAERAQG